MTAGPRPTPATAAGNITGDWADAEVGRRAGAERVVTPAAAWSAALRLHSPPPFLATAHRRVVVVAAHPDDETLGAGGALQALHRGGAALALVVATAGEAAYPALGAAARRELASHFAQLYAGGRDPWHSTSWYERRKRAVVLASLPRKRYRNAVEPGCGTGELTIELAARCAAVLASDPVADAVARARAATLGETDVRVEQAALPDAMPAGPIDLAVFSEVLYYLDDDVVRETLHRTLAALEPGGDVVVVHWRGWPAEAPRDAAATHQVLREHAELEQLVEHLDKDFTLLVLRRR